MRRLLFLLALFCVIQSFAQTYPLYIGTYTGSGSKGIYAYQFNVETGELKWVGNTDSNSISNPSYLALAPGGNFLYAVTETGGKDPGSVAAFIVESNGAFRMLNTVPTGGDHPCYLAVHKSGKWVVAGNYSGGNLAVIPRKSDGTLSPAVQVVQHEGTGPNKGRQEKAHVHMTLFSPDNRQLFVPDLGTDKVHIYQFQEHATSPLIPAAKPFVASQPGSGPRHLTFHPNGRFAYLMEELTGTVSAFAYKNGQLQLLQRLSSHPAGFKGRIGSADIHVSPDGKFLYASNRGDANSIAAFTIGANGKLTWVADYPSGGSSPRNFAITPDGKFLLAANQESGNVVVFKRDAQTGKLTPSGTEISIPKPVCLVFGQPAK